LKKGGFSNGGKCVIVSVRYKNFEED